MTLQEAIEEVKQSDDEVWGPYEFSGVTGHPPLREATATVLNAVVKGELKCESAHAAKK